MPERNQPIHPSGGCGGLKPHVILAPHMADETPLLELSAISVRRGRSNVLNSVDLTVSSGDVVLLLGENGSGKSTLIEAASGILRLSNGEVKHSGILIRDSEGRRSKPKPFGLTLQNGGFCQDELVRERISAAIEVSGHISNDEWISSELDDWSLRHRSNDRIAWLSGGMKRRVGVLAGLVPALASNDATLILLDEPSEGLDETSVNTLRNNIDSLASAGHAIIIATHDENLLPLATRQITVGNSSIVEQDITENKKEVGLNIITPLEENNSSNFINNPAIKWSLMLEKRTKTSTISRSVSGLIALVVIAGMLAQIEPPSNTSWLALLALTPALISSLVKPGILTHLSDSRSQDWWNAHIGKNLQMSNILPPLNLIPFILTIISVYVIFGNITFQAVIIGIVMSILCGGSSRIHALESTLPRQGATMIILLQIILIWPFLLLVDLLSMNASNFASNDAQLQLIVSTIIPLLVWGLLPMIAPE